MNAFLFILFIHIINQAYGIQHFIAVYAGKDFSEKGVGIFHNTGDCVNLGDDWQNQVSAANSHDNCIELYTELNCKGKMKYILPGSPAHSNFEALGINDALKSFRTCDLNEETICIKCDRKNTVEYNFWYYFFATQMDSLQRDYEKQAKLDGRFLRWNFILGNKFSNKGDQYQEMLDWAKHVISANVYPLNNKFCKQFMETLSKLSEAVVNERKTEIGDLNANWDDKKFVVHRHLITLWETLVRNIRYATSVKTNNEC